MNFRNIIISRLISSADEQVVSNETKAYYHRKIDLELRLPGARFQIFQKPSNKFEKKYIHVANNKIYKSANFHRKIPCISGSAKKTNTVFSGNTGPIQNWPTNS
jgi:hypothetical protein